MITSELRKIIRDEVRSQITVLTFGQSGENGVNIETIENMFPGSPSIKDRPIMHPFGFVSRAVRGVISVVGKVGNDPSNRMTLGHRDANKPEVDEGEASIYSSEGYQLKAMLDGIRLAKGDKQFALLLGDDVITFLGELVDLISTHTHGAPGTPPSQASQFVQLKTQNLQGKTMLSTKDGGFT